MEKLMIKNVLNKFGFVRIALVASVGLPLIFSSNSFPPPPAPFRAPPPPGGPEAPGGADRPATTTAPPPGATYTGEVPAPGEGVAERVIVTGSNIPTAAEQASIPVTTYTAQWLQKSGSNTPVEGLRQLPTFVGNADTENDSNGGNGAANINLRGLGPENTLILMNGRRLTAGGIRVPGPDVNLTPPPPIQKVTA